MPAKEIHASGSEGPGSDFAPYLKGENAVALLGVLQEANGFDRKTMYHLEIINLLIQNGQENLFKRIPQEVLGGLRQGQRRNVQASLVARADESTVRRGQGGLGESPEEIGPAEAPFLLWDTHERNLEAWARADGCWLADANAWAQERFGNQIANGTEARVYRYDGTHVAKVITSMFDPQETLDRISLTNFLLPGTGLELLALGRNADGEFCFVVKQPFVKGRHVGEGELTIGAFDTFECLNPGSVNPEYATDKYLLGDLHDRNVLVDKAGNIRVVDCNLFLNTPDLGRGGKWVIPEVESDIPSMREINALLESLLPGTVQERDFLRRFNADGLADQLDGTGRYEGVIPVRMKNGSSRDVLVQRNPDNPYGLLWLPSDKAAKLIRHDTRFTRKEKDRLAAGKTVSKGGALWRFDIDKGRVTGTKKTKRLARDNAKGNPIQ